MFVCAVINVGATVTVVVIASSRIRYCDNDKCAAVIVHGIGAVFVIATVLCVVIIAIGVIKTIVGVVKVCMNCNNHTRY